MNPIKFYRGDESSVVRETYEERSESIFAKQYELALGMIDRFLDLRKTTDAYCQVNNIFAIIGDRGMGKTSCMESVAEMIPIHRQNRGRFKKLETIDPSFFDENRNILEMVIGRMFAEFSADASDPSKTRNKDYESKKTDLLASFKKVRHTVAEMKSDKAIEDKGSIAKLQDLASAEALVGEFHTLVSNYLGYFDSDILILPVDDIDLNTTQAAVMVEQLRKYLVRNDIIILMAVKLKQLALVLEQDYARQYKTLREDKLLDSSALMDMVTRYLTKLIPLNQRIYMPEADTFFDKELQLYENRKKDSAALLKGSSVKYTVTSLIFRKCRYLFYHSKGVTSPVVPTNLRDLRHLVEMLYRMKDFKTFRDASNKEIFRNYLFGTWMPDNLDWDGCNAINEINGIKDASVYNSTVLSHLKKRFSEVFRNIPDVEFSEISSLFQSRPSRKNPAPPEKKESELTMDSENSTYNISVGDVFAVIANIKRTLTKQTDKVFIFLIETLYSMRLYHYYDEMTEKMGTHLTNKVDESIKKREIVDEFSNYEILTAGSLINAVYYNKLGAEGSTGMSRTVRPVLLTELRKCVDGLARIEGDWTEEQVRNLQMTEFFALHISHSYYTDRGRVNTSYRREKDLYYAVEFGPGREMVIFNLNSIFTNLCDVERVYNRVDERLYALSKGVNQSIFNSLMDKVKKERTPADEKEEELRHSFLSWVVIRNAEILEDFSEYMSKISDRRTNPINTKTFAEYYSDLSKYAICTYDKEDDEPYEIQFEFYSVFADALKRMDEEGFNRIFNSNRDTERMMDIDRIISGFKVGKTYKRLGILTKLSDVCRDLYENRPELKGKMKEAFPAEQYSYQKIKDILAEFKKINGI